MRLWQLKEAGETTTEEFTTLTDELTTAQKKVELLEGTVARFAGGGGIDLSGIDLSSILDPMTRIVDQTKALQEEMVDARDAFATLLAQLGHVSQGTDAWKTLTEQIKSSREELERMDQRLAALNTRAASITASRAQDLARVGEGLEVALTPLLRAQFKLQFEREPPKERLLPPGMVNLPNMMDPVTARLSNMSIKAQVDSLLQAMESVRDFAGEIDPGYIDIAAQRLTSLGLSTQEANQVLARFRGTMDEFSSSANLAISSIGGVIQGLIRGTDQLAESLTSAATQIIQTLIQIQTERRRQQIAQGITGGMSLGALGVLGTTVGAIGGIMGAVFGRRRDTQPVRIESVADSAAEALKERKEGPDTFILRVSGSDGRIEETQYVLNRRSRRDAVSRVPRGVTI